MALPLSSARGAPQVYTPPDRPRVFPAQRDFTIPLGTAQLFLPYIETPEHLPLDDYRLVVDLPAALELAAIDSKAGVQGQVAKQEERDGRRIVEIGVNNPFWGGMELSTRWGDKDSTLLAYLPALRVGGTCGWRRFSATVRSPARAASCRLLLIKWQARGLVGAAYFDDVVMRQAGSDKNLLEIGTFEEAYWREHPKSNVVEVERAGGRTHAARIAGTPETVNRQHALWVGEALSVKPDTDYVFEAWVKCEAVRCKGQAQSRAALLLRLDDPAFRGGEIRFGFRAHRGQVVEAAQVVPVRALPRLLGKMARHSHIAPCYYSDNVGREASAAIAENMRLSGINALYGRADNRVAQALRQAGGKLIWSFPYNGWQGSPAPELLKGHPDRQALHFKGSRQRARVCPTYALEEGSEFGRKLEAWVRRAAAGAAYDEVDIDYEVPVVDPPTFCFCPRCLAAFRAWAKLPQHDRLDAKIVVAKYRKAWTRFRCEQNAELIGRLALWIRSANPKLHVSAYSGYQCLRTREHYGVDWSLLAPHIDMGVAGYNGDRKALGDTVSALRGTPFMGGEMYYLSFTAATRGPIRRAGWKMRLLRCYVNGGCNGVLIWYLPVLDGQGYFETSQAAAVIADFEEFFKDGERADSRVRLGKDWPGDRYAAFAKRDKLLLLLFNPDREPQDAGPVRVEGWETVDGQRYDDVRGQLEPAITLRDPITLRPSDAQVWLLSERKRP